MLCRSRESARGSGHYSNPHCFLLLTIVPWIVQTSDLHLSVEEAAWVVVAAALTRSLLKEPMSRSSHELICAVSKLGFRV